MYDLDSPQLCYSLEYGDSNRVLLRDNLLSYCCATIGSLRYCTSAYEAVERALIHVRFHPMCTSPQLWC